MGGKRRERYSWFPGRDPLIRASGALIELMEGLWPVREFGGEELVAICGTAECVAPPGEAEKKSGD